MQRQRLTAGIVEMKCQHIYLPRETWYIVVQCSDGFTKKALAQFCPFAAVTSSVLLFSFYYSGTKLRLMFLTSLPINFSQGATYILLLFLLLIQEQGIPEAKDYMNCGPLSLQQNFSECMLPKFACVCNKNFAHKNVNHCHTGYS